MIRYRVPIALYLGLLLAVPAHANKTLTWKQAPKKVQQLFPGYRDHPNFSLTLKQQFRGASGINLQEFEIVYGGNQPMRDRLVLVTSPTQTTVLRTLASDKSVRAYRVHDRGGSSSKKGSCPRYLRGLANSCLPSTPYRAKDC